MDLRVSDCGAGLVVHSDGDGSGGRLLRQLRAVNEWRNQHEADGEDSRSHRRSITRKKIAVSLLGCRGATSLLGWRRVKREWVL
jgi:hypothetical protein